MPKYSPEALDAAVAAVKSGEKSYTKASACFGVPPATIQNAVKAKYKSHHIGAMPRLSAETEGLLVTIFAHLADWGFGLKVAQLQRIICTYLASLNIVIIIFPIIHFIQSSDNLSSLFSLFLERSISRRQNAVDKY